jgi:hypothetical protein
VPPHLHLWRALCARCCASKPIGEPEVEAQGHYGDKPSEKREGHYGS